MEQQGVIDVHLNKFQEVVAMQGCLVIEGHTDVAFCGFKQHLGGRGLGYGGERAEKNGYNRG